MLIGTDSLGTKVQVPIHSIATSGTAILAMRGAGKSWLNAVLAEGFSASKMPFVIIDPEGEYWTLRVKFSNIIVAGGEHADIPLEIEIAKTLAQTALEERLELILDLSEMRRKNQVHFLSQFLGELFYRETELRIPFWVSFEEADLWVPQSGNPPCKNDVLDICQRGRKRGLGFTLVSQRPATVDKTALSQAEYRFFKRFQQPHDLRAVGEYLGPFAEQAQSLVSLVESEAILFAPTISKKPIKFQVVPRVSPHGGATPEQIAQIKPSTTILALREKLMKLLSEKRREQSLVEQLQGQIHSLEQELAIKEEELSKANLANDIVEILAASRIMPTPSNQTEDEQIRSSSATVMSEDNFIIFNHIGVDTRSGLVVGNELAHLLMNRLESDERVIFLALQRFDKHISVKEISQHTGFGDSKVRRIVANLIRKGLVRLAGRERRGYLYGHSWEAISETG